MFLWNRRVYRVLEDWRLEKPARTYWSYCPQDVVALVSQYLTPEVFKEKFRTEQLWECVTKDDCHVLPYFLSDGSTLLEQCDRGMFLIDPSGNSQKSPTREGPSTLLALDHQGGFWYEAWNYEPGGHNYKSHNSNELIFHHYHPTSPQPSRILQRPAGSLIFSFIVTEDGTFYVLSDSPQRGYHQITKYHADGSPGPKYYGQFHLTHLSYKNGFLYLSGNGSLTWYKLYLLREKDHVFHQASARSLESVTWSPPTSWEEQEKKKKNVPVDCWFDHRPDGFLLTPRQIYWLVDGVRHHLVTLPSDLVADKLFVMPNGEFRLICHSLASFNVFSLHRID